MKKYFQKFDFGIKNFSHLTAYSTALILAYVFLTPYSISVDGFSYLKSSEVLFTSEFSTYYTWIREPGYPLFLYVVNGIGGLFLVFLVQGLFISIGILTVVFATYRLFGKTSVSPRSYVTVTISSILLAGYASTILQQASFILFFGVLLLIISRIVTERKFDLLTATLTFSLIALSSITAVFMGLAVGLALFATLVLSGVLKLKLLFLYSVVALTSFAIVTVPWLQIKASQSPAGTSSSLNIGASSALVIVQNFSLEKEVNELIQTQAALLNLGGEFPSSLGFKIANENRIFGAPTYSADHKCGRFLTELEPDLLWGKIETSYDERCVRYLPLALISLINLSGIFLYPLTGLSLIVALGMGISINVRLRPIILPAFIVTTPYLLLDASISRYGALVLALGSLVLVELLTVNRLSIFSLSTVSTNAPTKKD